MTFHLVNTSIPIESAIKGSVPPGSMLLSYDDSASNQSETSRELLFKKAILSGDLLVNSNATTDERGRPVVAFRFNTQGARKFGDVTTQNVGKPFAIVLDGKIISAPVIREPILGGSGIISGNFTVATANDLALLLRAGALPAPLKVIEERTVGPSLGADSIAAGKTAALVGIVLVMTFILLSYGIFGLFSNIALLMNMILMLGALSLFQATLTLPGIAGIVLTIGMAVDANVLIFERIREEWKLGKSVMAAMEAGFKRAFATYTRLQFHHAHSRCFAVLFRFWHSKGLCCNPFHRYLDFHVFSHPAHPHDGSRMDKTASPQSFTAISILINLLSTTFC